MGDGGTDDLSTHEVVIAIAASAFHNSLRPPRHSSNGLLIADECHRYGSASWANALDPAFGHRLGLTATYEREDSGIETHLDPYFKGVCYRLDYKGALADGAICKFKVAFAGVAFTSAERSAFLEHDERASYYQVDAARAIRVAARTVR